jgi:hypothetical protein
MKNASGNIGYFLVVIGIVLFLSAPLQLFLSAPLQGMIMEKGLDLTIILSAIIGFSLFLCGSVLIKKSRGENISMESTDEKQAKGIGGPVHSNSGGMSSFTSSHPSGSSSSYDPTL